MPRAGKEPVAIVCSAVMEVSEEGSASVATAPLSSVVRDPTIPSDWASVGNTSSAISTAEIVSLALKVVLPMSVVK